MPKENVHYACIACITIDSVMRILKNELSTSLFRRMQINMSKFINTEIQSESEPESKLDLALN